ncbi:MAG: VanZ family protein [Candidatus Omnitrophota bacterium]
MFNWIKEDRPIFAWVPSIIWSFVILMFSALPYKGDFQLLTGHFDKMAHFFEYAVLTVLLMRGAYRSWACSMAKNVLFALIFAIVYGIVMELIQRFIPGREMDVQDIIYNLIGAGFGAILGRSMLWRK